MKQENEDSSLYLHKCKKHGKENRRSGWFVHDGKETKRTLVKCIAKRKEASKENVWKTLDEKVHG